MKRGSVIPVSFLQLLIFLSPLSSHTLAMKTILVTGGNKGIGKAICERLLTEWSNTSVVLTARSSSRGSEAVDDIVEKLGQDVASRIDFLEMDVSSDASVQAAAKKYSAKKTNLYAIINNAGVGFGRRRDEVINTNYFGPKRVNESFGPFLQRPGGRIVLVASASGPMYLQNAREPSKSLLGKPWTIAPGASFAERVAQLDEIAKTTKESDAYGHSKALLNAYTHLLAKHEQPNDVLVNSCTPGYIQTDLTVGMGATNPPSKGAVPPCFLAMDEKVIPKAPPGRYYGSDCVRSPLLFYRGPGDPPYEDNEDI